MNKLAKAQQRNQLIGIGIGMAVLVAILYYTGVTAKKEELVRTKNNTATMQDKLKNAEATMKKGQEIAAQLEARQTLLQKREDTMAPPRDAYAWMITNMSPFLATHKGVNIANYSTPETFDNGTIPGFPYKWDTFHLEGIGYYHDFGRFFADLENEMRYFQVKNVVMNASASGGDDREKIKVTFDLVVPVKPSDTK